MSDLKIINMSNKIKKVDDFLQKRIKVAEAAFPGLAG